jgi:hypothetical protein
MWAGLDYINKNKPIIYSRADKHTNYTCARRFNKFCQSRATHWGARGNETFSYFETVSGIATSSARYYLLHNEKG